MLEAWFLAGRGLGSDSRLCHVANIFPRRENEPCFQKTIVECLLHTMQTEDLHASSHLIFPTFL